MLCFGKGRATFDEGNAVRDANWEDIEILFLAGLMLVMIRKGVKKSERTDGWISDTSTLNSETWRSRTSRGQETGENGGLQLIIVSVGVGRPWQVSPSRIIWCRGGFGTRPYVAVHKLLPGSTPFASLRGRCSGIRPTTEDTGKDRGTKKISCNN